MSLLNQQLLGRIDQMLSKRAFVPPPQPPGGMPPQGGMAPPPPQGGMAPPPQGGMPQGGMMPPPPQSGMAPPPQPQGGMAPPPGGGGEDPMQIIQQLLEQGIPPDQILQQLQQMGVPPDLLQQAEQMIAQATGGGEAQGGAQGGAPQEGAAQGGAAPAPKSGGSSTQAAQQEMLSRLSSLEGSMSMLVNIVQAVMGNAGGGMAGAPPAASMDAGAPLMPQASQGKSRQERVNSMILDLLGS